MPYTVGIANAKKHCYDVYLRVHGVAAGNDPWTTAFSSDITVSELKANSDPTNATYSADWALTVQDFTVGDFGRIGTLEENPFIRGSEGDSINTAACDSLTISEIIEGAFNQLEVTKANYTALRGLAANGFVDVLLHDKDETVAANCISAGARKVRLKVFPNVTGNDLNKIEMSFSKEAADLDDYFQFVTMA